MFAAADLRLLVPLLRVARRLHRRAALLRAAHQGRARRSRRGPLDAGRAASSTATPTSRPSSCSPTPSARTATRARRCRTQLGKCAGIAAPGDAAWSWSLYCAQRLLLIVGAAALAIWLWTTAPSRIGAIAVVTGLVTAHHRHVGLDHVGGRRHLREHRRGAGRHGDHQPREPGRRPPGQQAAGRARGRDPLRHVSFHYGAEIAARRPRRRHPRSLAAHHAGREGRPGRPLGRRQVDAGQPAAALLRPGGRPHPDRRAGHRPRHAGQPARADRHGDAGHLAAAPLGARQHPLRPARRRRGGSHVAAAKQRRRPTTSSASSRTCAAARATTPTSASAA